MTRLCGASGRVRASRRQIDQRPGAVCPARCSRSRATDICSTASEARRRAPERSRPATPRRQAGLSSSRSVAPPTQRAGCVHDHADQPIVERVLRQVGSAQAQAHVQAPVNQHRRSRAITRSATDRDRAALYGAARYRRTSPQTRPPHAGSPRARPSAPGRIAAMRRAPDRRALQHATSNH